ncbi:MAG: YbaN family protein [Acholeplasmataceae bacterium]
MIHKGKQSLFLILGFLSLSLGIIGVILPILPTTPFLLLTVIFFAKGSKRVHDWFIRTKLYQNHVETFVKTKKMTRSQKIKLLITVTTLFTIAIVVADATIMTIVLLVVLFGHYYYILFRVETISRDELALIQATLKEKHV